MKGFKCTRELMSMEACEGTEQQAIKKGYNGA